jgi:hypothetical protein
MLAGLGIIAPGSHRRPAGTAQGGPGSPRSQARGIGTDKLPDFSCPRRKRQVNDSVRVSGTHGQR